MNEPGHQPTPSRMGQRRPVQMRGYMVRRGGLSHVIHLTDLNYGGCGIRTDVPLEEGETVTLSVLDRGSIPAEVRWYEDGKAGLVFEPEPEKAPEKIERSVGRFAVPGEVGLRAAGKTNYRVRVLDLSTNGCKVELVERPAVGDRMMVKFDGIEVLNADVAWVEAFVAGLNFENSIHPAVLDLLLRRLGAN